MNRLNTETRAQIIRLLVEGMAINAIVRTTGISKPTILKLLKDLGSACENYLRGTLVNLNVKFVEADEVWSFVYSKEKNVPEKHHGEFGYGDVWTWWAVDADTKLIFSWHVGMRSAEDAQAFVTDIAGRVDGRFQLTTDGLKSYLRAVLDVFGTEIDFAQLVKQYGEDPSWEK